MKRCLLLIGFLVAACASIALANAGKPFDFVAVNRDGAPVYVQEGAGVIKDSTVGNQDFYAETCFAVKNESHKQVNAVRYQLTYFSLFKEKLGQLYRTEVRQIKPYAEDRPADPGIIWSDCLQKVNNWDSIGRVEFAVDAVMFADGTMWRAVDHPSRISKTVFVPDAGTPAPSASPTARPTRRPGAPVNVTPADAALFGANYDTSCEDIIVGPLFPDGSSLNERDARLAASPELQDRVALCEAWREQNPAPPTPQPTTPPN